MKRFRFLAQGHARSLGALTVALCLNASFTQAEIKTQTTARPATLTEAGTASYYADKYHGRPTASGEIFDMHQLTAAHRTLPFGTRLLVTNRDTSQSAEVRVNDRGPFVEGRILDVSYAAGRLLGAVGPGIIPVRVRVLSLPARSSSGDGPYTVQIGSFTTRTRAEALRDAVTGATIAETSGGRDRLPRPGRRLPRSGAGRRRRPRSHHPRLPGPRRGAVAAGH